MISQYGRGSSFVGGDPGQVIRSQFATQLPLVGWRAICTVASLREDVRTLRERRPFTADFGAW